jgi:hypothetical protein
MSEENLVEEEIKIQDDLLVLSDKDAYLSNTLILGSQDISSLTISKDAKIDDNRILNINNTKYNLTLSPLLSPEEIKFVFDNKYFIKIYIPNINLVTNLLKISKLDLSTNFSSNINLQLEELF